MSCSNSSITKASSGGKRPKRPLTPYNLFYRFKRGRILHSCSIGNGDKETIRRLVAAVPGLENMSPSELRLLHPKDVYAVSRDIIRKEMQENLLPFEGKRAHRKTHGMMEFVEMSRMMCDQWKLVDESIKRIFQELAEEGKQLYRERLSEYKDTEQESERCSGIEDPTGDDSVNKLSTSNREAKCSDVHMFPENLPPLPPLVSFETEEDVSCVAQCIPCSPAPSKQGKVNIVSPISRPSVFQPEAEVDDASMTSDVNDEFCAFIDDHIHVVDNVGLNAFDLYDGRPVDFMDLITMDESIDHCTLSLVGIV
ncbi:hypothetical protein HJC23_012623 [Cyclotella cryptica]|uniref:HMG box domain-containing protein n=1 Tax=Cyclotella cryptica TaxID=29204 RepID=A0ABD3QMA9_9STRA